MIAVRESHRRAPVLAAARTIVAYAVLPLVLAAIYLHAGVQSGWFGADFRAALWGPAHAVLAGASPYPPPVAAQLTGNPFLYPPIVALLGVPLTVLPLAAAEIMWTLGQAAAIVAACRTLGVRDWRCYALALMSVPVLDGLAVGNVTFALILLLALAWRWRERRWIPALLVGVVVAIKPFLWPVFVWFVLTRRGRAAATSVATALVVALVPWALIGFHGLSDYGSLLREFDKVVGTESFSIYALAAGIGLPAEAGHFAQWSIGLALLLVAVRLRNANDADARIFTTVLIAALLLSPIVWRHYFALLLVPIAIRRPRLDAAWLLPMAFWLALFLPGVAAPNRNDVYQRAPAEIALALLILAVAFAVGVARPARAALRRTKMSPVGSL